MSAPQPDHLVRLNPEQYRAVTTLEGPLLILAGAGSGKTRVLTRRIAHLLHTGIDPKMVLAVTFTNKAAAEMRERVEELVGEAGRKVWVSTFHSSCVRILRQDIEHLGYTSRFAIYDDDDQSRILKHILAEQGWDDKKLTPKAMLGKIDHYKNRLVTRQQLLAQTRSHTNDPFMRIWEAYDEALQASDALDFNDLIGFTVRLFKEHPDVLAKWQERFHYMMVDEYQDTNNGQYQLLHLLAAKHRNLGVVGDDDQSIYGFRGADISNILGFEKDFPDAAVIRLEQNYRCSGNILTVANHVIAKNTERKEKALWTEGEQGRPVRMVAKSTPQAESDWVAQAVQGLRRQGLAWEDIAIVYRTNATSRLFERALSRARIPHKIVGGRKFYERREVRDILGYLRLVANPADDAAFLRVCNVPTRGLGAKTLATLREEAATRGEPLLQAARGAGSGKTKSARALGSFVALIDELAEAARTLEPHLLVESVVKDSGYAAMLTAEATKEAEGRLENLSALYTDARQSEPPEDALTPIERLRAWLDRVALTGQDEDIPDGGQVTLLTVHNAKGLEYPVVFCVHMMEGQFPHARSAEEPGGVEEERRLAYVAFTRAKRLLVITWNAEGTAVEVFGNSPGPRPSSHATPSRFICDLPPTAIEGDIPSLEPAMMEVVPEDRERLDRRLGTFLANHRARAASLPEDTYRLNEIEDIAQLRHGRRVHHGRHGLGTVQSLDHNRLRVLFDNAGSLLVSMGSGDLHLVDE